MTSELANEFEVTRERIARRAIAHLGEDALEYVYEDLLFFLQSHLDQRAELVQYLIDDIKSQRNGSDGEKTRLPLQAIAYCMHELRWHEVLGAAKLENDEFYSLKKSTLMSSIIDSFDDHWEDRVFYRRFKAH